MAKKYSKKPMTYKGTKQVAEDHPLHFDGVAKEANLDGHDPVRHGHVKLSGSLMHELQGKGEMSNAYGKNEEQGESMEDETMQPSGVGPQQRAKAHRGY